jgi:hypothetical protein
MPPPNKSTFTTANNMHDPYNSSYSVAAYDAYAGGFALKAVLMQMQAMLEELLFVPDTTIHVTY